jgi:hypothetical protein
MRYRRRYLRRFGPMIATRASHPASVGRHGPRSLSPFPKPIPSLKSRQKACARLW